MTNPVRTSVQEFVEDDLEHIDLKEDNYGNVVDEIEEKEFGYVPWNWPPFPNADEIGEKDIIDFFMVGNAINFQFRDPKTGEDMVTNETDSFTKEHLVCGPHFTTPMRKTPPFSMAND
ncbi:MAG: hypothetical protein BRC29_03330 [Nanohaloarchaea archaeon SW_7_43_1]|nr:MAG: hypothetical protein BRC29_03330 [Nanohaloarchaea archaeon SW_7_43_1]